MKYFMVFVLAILCLCGCGDEGIENALYPLTVASAPSVDVVTAVPPEIQSQLWDRFGSRETLVTQLADIVQGDDGWEDRIDWLIRVIARMDQNRAFYTRYINAGGIVIVGTANVDDVFFIAARDIVLEMTWKHTEIRDQLLPHTGFYMALLTNYDPTDQGLPSRLFNPPEVNPVTGLCAGGYCLSRVWYGADGMKTFVHEFAHAVHSAINGEGRNNNLNAPLDATFDDRLKAAYNAAMDAGKWEGDYASTNYREYWAEGVEMWYNLSGSASRSFATLQEFEAYDPLLYALLSEWFYKGKISGGFYP